MYIVFDTETGGLGPEFSLLTAYFAIVDKDKHIVDELDLKLIPDDGIYRVGGQGLGINKIDLVKLSEEAIPYKEAKTVLYKFLQKNDMGGGNQLIPIGQNVAFDVQRITSDIISKGSWDVFISRRPLDTMIISRFLQNVGLLPPDLGLSLVNLIDYFEVVVDGNPHEAKYDALSTLAVLKKLQEKVIVLSQGFSY